MTIVISSSSSKIPKSSIFSPKFKDFYFCTTLCNKTNLRTLISNMTIVFWNSSPKICKLNIFGPKFKDFYFCTKLYCKADSETLISNMTTAFQNCRLNHPNKVLLVPSRRIIIFAQNFAIRQIWRRWFQIWQRFLFLLKSESNYRRWEIIFYSW